MDKKSFFSKIKERFSSQPIIIVEENSKIEEEDRAVLAGITQPKGSATPTPVHAKAEHAGMVYNPSLATAHGEELYTPAEYNLSTVANAFDTDSYFRRSVEKYVELIWKAGYSFYGKNPRAVTYIQRRFEQIAMVTTTPTEQLFLDMSYQLVEFSNVYVSKVRKNEASGGMVRTDFTGKIFQPVAGYFVEDPVSMYLAVKKNGDPIGYKQMMRGVYSMNGASTGNPVGNKSRSGSGNSNYYKIWYPENMIHIVYSKKPGMRVGTPMVWPVMDDIRALRRIEQNVELLVFQHTIPLFQYIIGTDSRPAQPDEIAAVKQVVERMPPNGCIVTPERHTIKAIGVEGSLIDASVYLTYYKDRVLAGLGMSGVGMGQGGTSNKGTAVVLDKHLVNTSAMFQRILKIYIDEFMIKELLAEGGFDVSYINGDNKVGIHFPPIDTEEQRAKENHYAQMYTQHVINEDEMRHEFGREPVKDDEREKNFISLVYKKQKQIDARFAAKSGPATSKAANVGATKARPANQHGKLSTKPTYPKNDEIESLINVFKDTKNDLIDTCIDTIKDGYSISNKLNTIKRYNFDNSKLIIEKLKSRCSKENSLIFNDSLVYLNNLYERFVNISDTTKAFDISNKINAMFDTICLKIDNSISMTDDCKSLENNDLNNYNIINEEE